LYWIVNVASDAEITNPYSGLAGKRVDVHKKIVALAPCVRLASGDKVTLEVRFFETTTADLASGRLQAPIDAFEGEPQSIGTELHRWTIMGERSAEANP
jgi:hypothetical protein